MGAGETSDRVGEDEKGPTGGKANTSARSPDPEIVAAAGATFDVEAAVRASEALAARLATTDGAGTVALVREWDATLRAVRSWSTSQSIRFRCDTRDPEAGRGREASDAAEPRIAEARRVFLAALLASGGDSATPDSPGQEATEGARVAAVRAAFGDVVVDRWRCELGTFDSRVAEHVAREQRLASEHMALVGGASVEFQGSPHTLAALAAHASSGNRDLRRAAAMARWGWFAEHRAELDDIFDRLVRCRDGLARSLDRPSFVDLAYDRMPRTDYDAHDVAVFRDGIRSRVVPIAERLREAQRGRLGLDVLHIYDEVPWAGGPEPAPGGDSSWLEARAAELFRMLDARQGTRLGELFAALRTKGLLDLVARPRKGPGGFCSFLEAGRMPFVFANFDGTSGDARVFTHEMGHAYQGWCSDRALELSDQRRCTSESAEIHSMSLEFLTAPHMEVFFGEAAARYRASHRARAVWFLPYGCAIDEFQHEVYQSPGWSPEERHAAWQDIERKYLPGRSWDGIEHGERGAAWQAQLHVFQYPFYYIDYVLAQLVALQFAALAQHDETEAWRRFQRLCDLGGSQAFRGLVREAGMADPFDESVIADVIGRAAGL